MMLSKIARSISKFSRSMNVLSGGNGGRSHILSDSSSVCESRYAIRKVADDDDKFGVVLNRYNLGSVAANSYQRNGSVLSHINSVLSNPRNRRLFHSLQKKKREWESSTERVEKFSKGKAFILIVAFFLIYRARQGYLDSKRILSEQLDNLEITIKKLEELKANGWKMKADQEEEKED